MVTAAIIAVSVPTAMAAVMSSWVRVQDSCGKCIMNDTTRKCGKCGGFMKSVGEGKATEGNYVEYNYKCQNSNCGHTIKYRNK